METLKVTGTSTHDDERQTYDDERQTHGPLLQLVAGMARLHPDRRRLTLPSPRP